MKRQTNTRSETHQARFVLHFVRHVGLLNMLLHVTISSCQELFTAEERLENNGEEYQVGLMCCGQWRSFDIGVFDAQGTEVCG